MMATVEALRALTLLTVLLALLTILLALLTTLLALLTILYYMHATVCNRLWLLFVDEFDFEFSFGTCAKQYRSSLS